MLQSIYSVKTAAIENSMIAFEANEAVQWAFSDSLL